jgi:hypothetical protein
MTRLLRGAACLLPILALLSCSSSKEPATPAAPPAQSAAEPASPAPPGWKHLDSKDGGFTALIPESANEKKQPIEGTTLHLWLGKHEGAAYMLSFFDRPSSTKGMAPPDVLHGEAAGFFTGCRGALVKEKMVDDAPHPVLRVLGACGHGEAVIGEVHLVRERIYQAFVIVADEKTTNEETVKRFLDSFKLKS